MLIKINNGLILDSSEIKKIWRNGEYTVIETKNNQMYMEPDADKDLWNRCEKASV